MAAACFPAQFEEDLAFLKKHAKVLVLSEPRGRARVVVVPAWQGRVMTSTDGASGDPSYGWLNRDLIASGKVLKHFNPLGGEDRFWMGPEGGQFSIFFAKGDPFELAHWQTPLPIDTEPFDLVSQSPDRAALRRRFPLVNYSGTRFDVQVDRVIRVVPSAEIWKLLGVSAAANVTAAGFESVNRTTNTGQAAWEEKTGLLSIWVLGMFNATPDTTVVVPIREGAEAKLGPRVNSDYFGKVPAERLVAQERAVFFKADGRYRSKIGAGPGRAKPLLGSYDASAGVLTIVQYTLPTGATRYVNSQWKIQDQPYAGDVINSYSDDGKMGNFYEIESSSPAAALAPGKSIEHVHRTIHLRGPEAVLDPIARATLGVSLSQIKSALPK
ncbi:MAG: hypothetical protein JNL98_30415 [Bryobacterales bacterium]|nr:hypothetical protein [Bryobacterales bacterium]